VTWRGIIRSRHADTGISGDRKSSVADSRQPARRSKLVSNRIIKKVSKCTTAHHRRRLVVNYAVAIVVKRTAKSLIVEFNSGIELFIKNSRKTRGIQSLLFYRRSNMYCMVCHFPILYSLIVFPSLFPKCLHCWHSSQVFLLLIRGCLRSALSTPIVRRTRLSTVGDQAFPVATAHRVWNKLRRHASNITVHASFLTGVWRIILSAQWQLQWKTSKNGATILSRVN